MEKLLCIHSHFYQPPRENPWLEAIEIQDSARPYHDWNERISMECYAPNSASRILDGEGRIVRIASNYAKISFNFGPTVLSWMERFAPEIYLAILDADKQSIQSRSGHGNAIAQVYNHIIMPLANTQDKRTQIQWGIMDFNHRFGRHPEGMWLAETAVDVETLEILAESGIKFTILAPHQAARMRKTGSGKWRDVSGSRIDPTRAYLCRLPSGNMINIFFYDGPISRAVAFEGILEKGEHFADRLLSGYSEARNWPQLLSIATDGETYGHHRKFGDMALAYALDYIESNSLARLTNYGEYLENHPATHEVQIYEHTSWSCAHGIERWRSDCGCNSGQNPYWNQEWRKPLREAFDWLRDKLAVQYVENAKRYFKDPWAARNGYIDIVLDRSEDNLIKFFDNQAQGILNKEEKIYALKLLEMQRHTMLMYTSCGWFFDELSGLETVQVIQYAGRALQLSEELFRNGLEGDFLKKIADAISNIPEYINGSHIYEKWVKPAMIDLKKVGIHYAVSSLFEDYPEKTYIYNYSVEKIEYYIKEAGITRMALGKISVTSGITGEGELLSLCVLSLGSQMLNGGVRTFLGDEAYISMKDEMDKTMEMSDFAETIRLMDKHFGMHNYSFKDLFRDEQRKILNLIVGKSLEDFEHTCRAMYEQNRGVMGFLQDTGMPMPMAFKNLAEFLLNFDLTKAFLNEELEAKHIQNILHEIKRWNIKPDTPELEFTIRRKIEALMEELFRNPSDFSVLYKIEQLIEFVQVIPIDVNYWQIQNIYDRMAKTALGTFCLNADNSNERTVQWTDAFKRVGELLFFNMEAVLAKNNYTGKTI
jgi:alpha-amylase/alpha-mannosidase (GH57 family)